ncbi:hypothetical protein [Deinococcus navajonensis]|uniref:Lipoprotein n=1 Tax=Deinococcus navajonensis TaxID=309884 RepID=A0ABV8XRQ3_9DEIO
MQTRVIAALVLGTLSACGRLDTAPQPAATLGSQGIRTTTSFSFTDLLSFPSPCTGEFATGPFTVSGEESVVMDASGGTHVQVDVVISGTYMGEAGTTFTESSRGRFHINLPSSGAVNAVNLLNGQITGSDGSTLLTKDRIVLVRDARGVVRVERSNLATTALRCQGP